jgi:hypothetical protein
LLSQIEWKGLRLVPLHRAADFRLGELADGLPERLLFFGQPDVHREILYQRGAL